ncbi:MAG TPA: VCBS repeat-containing protein [Terracidiphilus sp.]
MSHPAYLPVAIIVAALTAVSAHAGAVVMPAEISSDGIAGWTDTPEGAPVVIAAGDFNRDGIADLAEATAPDGENSGPHLLTVMLGRKDGTFTTVASHTVIGANPRALVVGDFNGDGNPDVIVGDGDGAILEFLGDGRGNMAPGSNIPTAGSVVSLAAGHFTKDGNLDIVISDVRSNSATILLGAGNGSFRLGWSFQLPRRGTEFHIATADFNKDGIADLVITGGDDNNYEVMLGNGNGTFSYAPELSHLRDPNSYCPS